MRPHIFRAYFLDDKVARVNIMEIPKDFGDQLLSFSLRLCEIGVGVHRDGHADNPAIGIKLRSALQGRAVKNSSTENAHLERVNERKIKYA